MLEDHDSPHIEELVDADDEKNAEEAVKKEFFEFKNEIEKISCLPNFTKDSEKLRQVLAVIGKAIDKWEEDEDNEGSIEVRRKYLKELKERYFKYDRIIEKAEQKFFARREQEMRNAGMKTTRYYPGHGSSNHQYPFSREEDVVNSRSPSRHRPNSGHPHQHAPKLSSCRQQHGYNYWDEKLCSRSPRRSNLPIRDQFHQSSTNAQRELKAGKSRVTKKVSHKYCSGQRAIAEIKHYQKTTELLIQKAPFARLVQEVVQEATSESSSYSIRTDALSALQEGAEAFLVEMFEGSSMIANHAKRATLGSTDLKLYRRLCLRNL